MNQPFSTQLSIKVLDSKHPELLKREMLYDDLRLLFHGGKDLKDNAFRFLVKREKEIQTSFLSRERQVKYDPVLDTIVSWYSAKLFEHDIEIQFDAGESSGVDDFYASFLEVCDRGDMSFQQFFERVTEELLVYSKAYFLIDLPKLEVEPTNLYQQKALGGLNPYLSHLDIMSVLNWQNDKWGNYQWVIVKNCDDVQQLFGPTIHVETWTIYNQQQYATYQVRYADGQARPTEATLVDSANHAMAGLNTVPVVCVSTRHKFWLGNRLYLSLIDHFNIYTTYGYSLNLANAPIPVITDGSENGANKAVDLNQTVSEYSFLHLPNGGKAEYMEPEGRAWEATAKYLEQLRENMYRQAHVAPIGRSTRATPASQSGYSKELEMEPSHDVLNVLGTKIRTVMQWTLNAIASIRKEKVETDIRGLNFSEDTAAFNVNLMMEAKAAGIHSTLAMKELEKRTVRSLFPDANAAKLQAMEKQIDDTPDAEFEFKAGQPGQDTVALNITERSTQVQ